VPRGELLDIGQGVAEKMSSVRVPASGPVRIVARPMGRIEGKITWSDGSPISRYVVAVSGPDEGHASTDDQGQFSIDHLLPGKYSVQIRGCVYECTEGSSAMRPNDGADYEGTARVVPDRVTALDIKLKPLKL